MILPLDVAGQMRMDMFLNDTAPWCHRKNDDGCVSQWYHPLVL